MNTSYCQVASADSPNYLQDYFYVASHRTIWRIQLQCEKYTGCIVVGKDLQTPNTSNVLSGNVLCATKGLLVQICTLHEEIEGVVGGIEQHTHHVPGLEFAPVASHARSVAGSPKAIKNPALFHQYFAYMEGAPKGGVGG